MPSHLRLHSSIEEPFEATAVFRTSSILPPVKKQKMSLTQSYYLASTARGKLGKEASRSDHDLRKLVLHANMLDSLMIELADAEAEQSAWFESSVRKAAKPEEPRHIKWIDQIDEVSDDEDEDDSDAESDADSDTYDEDAYYVPLPRIRSPPIIIESEDLEEEEEEEEEDDEDDENDDEHALMRIPSQHAPPELLLDESDSEDDSMPPSPDQPTMDLSEKQRQAITTTGFYQTQAQQGLGDYMDKQSHMIAAF